MKKEEYIELETSTNVLSSPTEALQGVVPFYQVKKMFLPQNDTFVSGNEIRTSISCLRSGKPLVEKFNLAST